ncbi:MAG: radical SAM protein [Verrucomicrobia bacterium]|nr:radical SAM protein [Verrucomicrobiota bacterium]
MGAVSASARDLTRSSGIGSGAVWRGLWPVLKRPWIASRLVSLQLEKHLFAWRYPPHPDGRAGKIRQVSLRLTDLCNLRCGTCGQWGEQGYLRGEDLKKLKASEVPPARYIELFRDLAAHGHRPIVYLWGGEPMLYDGVLDLVEAATKCRMPVAIATNGTRIAEAATRLVRAPLFLLQVSIDGHDAALHNRLRPAAGGSDNFKTVEAALEAVRQARVREKTDLPLIASLTTISRENAPHLADIYEAFAGRVDFFVFYLAWWIDEARAAQHDRDFERRFGFVPRRHRGWIGGWKPDRPEELHRQIRRVLERSRRHGAPPVVLIPRLKTEVDLRTYYTDHACDFGYRRCLSIYHALEVNSNGDVSPCRDYHDFVVGNVKGKTFTELWNDDNYRRFRRSLAADGLMPVCTRCCGLMGY